MKIIIILVLFFNLNTYGKYFEGKVVLKNNTEKNGLIELGKNLTLNFKVDKKSEKEVIKGEDIKYVLTIDNKYNQNKYEFHLTSTKGLVGNKEKMRLLKIIVEGNINLYVASEGLSYSTGGSGVSTFSTSTYFLKRLEETKPTFFVAFGYVVKQDFKTFIKEYFKDCNELITKVNKNELKEKHSIEIASFYNNNCK